MPFPADQPLSGLPRTWPHDRPASEEEVTMKLPLQIVARDIPLSEASETDIRTKAAQLDLYYDQIMSCRVILEGPVRHHHIEPPTRYVISWGGESGAPCIHAARTRFLGLVPSCAQAVRGAQSCVGQCRRVTALLVSEASCGCRIAGQWPPYFTTVRRLSLSPACHGRCLILGHRRGSPSSRQLTAMAQPLSPE